MEHDLKLTHRSFVYPWQCDNMGHMNTLFYAAAYDAAAMALLVDIESMDSLAARGLGWADVRQTIEYRHEVRSGQALTVETGIVRIGTKSFTALHVMSNDSKVRVSVCETVCAQFDLERRQAAPIDPSVRKTLELFPKADSET